MYPEVTVIVVCYNEERRISSCLESILNQDFAELFEVLVVNNQSTDATSSIVKNIAEGDSRVRVIENNTRVLSSGRNIGWRTAVAPLVTYTDADCIVPTHWLRVLVEAYRKQKATDPQLAGVGGGNFQPDNTPFYQALRGVLESPVGNRGSTQTKSFAEGRYVESLAALNVLYEKKILEKIGGYDDVKFPRVGEDEDLNCRLLNSGHRVYFVPGCDVLHFWRDNFYDWCRNMYLYGFGRAKLRRRHPSKKKWTDLLCVAVPIAIVLACCSWLCWLCLLPLVGYLGILSLASLLSYAKIGKVTLALRVFSLFFGTHFYYGLGLIRGTII